MSHMSELDAEERQEHNLDRLANSLVDMVDRALAFDQDRVAELVGALRAAAQRERLLEAESIRRGDQLVRAASKIYEHRKRVVESEAEVERYQGYIRSSRLVDCLILSRADQQIDLFNVTTGQFYLDRYAIIPREDYETMQQRERELEAEAEWLRYALHIIAGKEQPLDNLMGNTEIARRALQEKGDE